MSVMRPLAIVLLALLAGAAQAQSNDYEVQRLRSQIEALQRQLTQLQQDQQRQYQDLVQRLEIIAAMRGDGPGSGGLGDGGEAIYRQGVDAFTRGQAQEALRLFTSVQAEHPDSDYAARSLYWMGEAYEVLGDTLQAEQSYAALLERYPGHARFGHAAYKLALLHHRQAREARAWCLLQRALAAPEQQVSALAAAYISQFFDPPPSVTCPP